MAPQLAPAPGGGLWLSWLEPTATGHRLRAARFDGSAWGTASTVAEGNDFFANWADVPSVAEGEDGELVAQWLAKLGDGTYAYGVHLARSTDGGETWQPTGLLHPDDRSPTEHGFATLLAAPGGGFDAVWLDGRETADGGAMTLRHARVEAGRPTAAERLDDRVCDCCPTTAVRDAAGELVVAYRDRGDAEVRDLSTVRRAAGGGAWSEPATVHADGWTIPGCPVNGPALALPGGRTAIAWFTAENATPRVLAAFADDGGPSFGPPIPIDQKAPLGRVGLAALDGDAVVSWLSGDGVVRLRRVAADGGLGEVYEVARTSAARAAGVPRVAVAGGRLFVAWVEVSGGDGDERPRAVRFAEVPAELLSRPGA